LRFGDVPHVFLGRKAKKWHFDTLSLPRIFSAQAAILSVMCEEPQALLVQEVPGLEDPVLAGTAIDLINLCQQLRSLRPQIAMSLAWRAARPCLAAASRALFGEYLHLVSRIIGLFREIARWLAI